MPNWALLVLLFAVVFPRTLWANSRSKKKSLVKNKRHSRRDHIILLRMETITQPGPAPSSQAVACFPRSTAENGLLPSEYSTHFFPSSVFERGASIFTFKKTSIGGRIPLGSLLFFTFTQERTHLHPSGSIVKSIVSFFLRDFTLPGGARISSHLLRCAVRCPRQTPGGLHGTHKCRGPFAILRSCGAVLRNGKKIKRGVILSLQLLPAVSRTLFGPLLCLDPPAFPPLPPTHTLGRHENCSSDYSSAVSSGRDIVHDM